MKRIQTCESLVLAGEDWVQLRYRHILSDTAEVMIEGFADITNPVFAEVMFEGVESLTFVPGVDYELDGERGLIRRLPGSRIRDFAQSPFFGQNVFDHEPYHGRWGNYPFTVFISYIYEDSENVLVEDEARGITCALRSARPQAAIDRLLSGDELTYMVYGDSISTGCEALYVRDTYFARFADRLQRVTGGRVDVVNEAIGGETSREGLSRFAAALERHGPHLVSIAYGINDMCVKPDRPADLTPQQYIDNVRAMVDMARAAGAEVILITNCLPNPHWKYTSAGYKDYAAALRVFAREQALPIADVQALWERELAHGKRLSDLLFNDVNHPTSYGHYLYAAMLETLI